MINDNFDSNDNIIAIISYCNIEEKVNALIDNINLIRKKYKNFKIALHANYPLSYDVQKMVDIYIYEDLNAFCDKNCRVWKVLPYFGKKFNYYFYKEYGYSVFQQIRSIAKHLIDYKNILLINYDLVIEDLYIDNYLNSDHDLVIYRRGLEAGCYLLVMNFNPLIFSNKVSNFFNYDLYASHSSYFAEVVFYDCVKNSDIDFNYIDYNVKDKISNMPYLAFKNEYFVENLVSFNNNYLELYFWELKNKIEKVEIEIDNNNYLLINENKKGAFESHLEYKNNISKINIIKIDDNLVNIPLKIIENTVVEPFMYFEFSYDKDENKLRIFTYDEIQAKVLILNSNKSSLISSVLLHFNNNRLWYIPEVYLYDFGSIIIQIIDMNDNLIKEELMILKK